MKTCPKCGGTMTVKRKDGVSVCEYCDSTFSLSYLDALASVQLDNATPVTRKTQVEYSSSPSADRLVKSAETNMSLGDYSSAFKNFEQVSKSYPEDYRGWFGMARASTQDFRSVGNPSNVELWWSYTKKLASKTQFLKCKSKYGDYLTIRGKADAEADLRAVAKCKTSLESEITTHKNKIAGLHNAHTQAVDRKEASVNIARAALEKAEKKSQSESAKNMFCLVVGVALGLLTLWLALEAIIDPSGHTIINILAWIIIAIMGGGTISLVSSGTDTTYANERDKAQKDYEAAQREARAARSETVDESTQADAIQLCMQRISMCEKYLAMREKVEQYYIKKRLKEIDDGISLSSFSSLTRFRNQIFSNSTGEED